MRFLRSFCVYAFLVLALALAFFFLPDSAFRLPPSALECVGRFLLLLFFLGLLVSPFSYITLAVNPALPASYKGDPATVTFEQQDVTIPTAASNGSPQVFTLESFSLTFDSDWVVQNNSAARPAKQYGRPKVPEVDLELQFVSNTTAPPYLFAEFICTGPWGVSYKFIVSRVNSVSKNDGSASKITIGARYGLTI